MKQRLGIAMALINNPELLTLDGPTNGLYPLGIQELRELRKKFSKKGKKYCPHSKGIQEAAIEKAFVESYRQLCHADSTVIDDFLKIVEEEIKDNTLVKELKKIENQLNRIISQERKLVDLHLEDSIDEEVYAKKYKKLTKQKEELLDKKKTLELTIKDENSIKERLKQF